MPTTAPCPAWPCGCRPTAMPSCRDRNGAWTTPRSPASSAPPGCACPAAGPGRFAARAAFLTSDDHRGAWLQWRADELHRFYARVRQALAADCPDGAALPGRRRDALRRRKSRPNSAPSCPPKTPSSTPCCSPASIPRQYQDDPNIVLLRSAADRARRTPQCPGHRPGNQPDARRRRLLRRPALSGEPVLPSAPGGPHPLVRAAEPIPRRQHLAAHAVGPLVAGQPPRFVHSLASDGLAGADRRRLAAVDGPGRVAGRVGGDLSPAAGRAFRGGGRVRRTAGPPSRSPSARPPAKAAPTSTPSTTPPSPSPPPSPWRPPPAAGWRPWPARATPARWGKTPTGCAGRSSWDPTTWRPRRSREPAAKLSHPQVSIPPAAAAALAAHIQPTRPPGRRAADPAAPAGAGQPQLPAAGHRRRSRPRLGRLPPPGRQPCNSTRPQRHGRRPIGPHLQRRPGRLPGEPLVRSAGHGPALDVGLAPRGRRPPATAPAAGPARANSTAATYYRFAAIGQPQTRGQPGIPIAATWRQFIFQVDDLPLEGLSPLHVRFDLHGAGRSLGRRRAVVRPGLQRAGTPRPL